MKSDLDKRFEAEALCHKDALMAYALHLTHHEKDAEDLLQDTLIKAYRHFDKYESETNCKAWLCRVMTNEFITQYRHQQREHACVDRNSELDENCPDNAEKYYPDDLYNEQSEDFGDEVSHALNHVPEDFKAIVVMADLQDRSYREISEQLEIPIGTVMSRLFRGRQILRKMLHKYAASLGITR